MEDKKTEEQKPIMNPLDGERKSFLSPKLIAALVIVVILGVGTGYFLAKRSGTIESPSTSSSDGSTASKGTTVGSSDTETFKDTAEGVLEEGGLKGEGQFHLVRPGGDSQSVYLTSSIIDLSKFLKKKVKVWGQTQEPQHVGWLMDVGRLEVK